MYSSPILRGPLQLTIVGCPRERVGLVSDSNEMIRIIMPTLLGTLNVSLEGVENE